MMSFHDDDLIEGGAIEPTPGGLVHWVEEQYAGDGRFESIEVLEPGPVEGEAARVAFIVNDHTRFFVAVRDEDERIRVGLCTEDHALSKRVEQTALETSGSLNDYLADAMGTDDELEHEVQHFHDEAYYFCSDIPYHQPEELASTVLHDEIIYYLDGYMNALYDLIQDAGGD